MAETAGQRLVARIFSVIDPLKIPIGQFCKLAYVNRSTFARWRAGLVSPTLTTAERVNGVLDRLQAQNAPAE